MDIELPERDRLRSTDAAERSKAVTDLLARTRRSGARAITDLSAAVELLKEVPDWSAVLAITDVALLSGLDDAKQAEWLVEKGWCLFWLDRRTEAEQVVQNARQAAEAAGSTKIRTRAYLLSGYVMDVRSAHPEALAWYTRALAAAPAGMRAQVLLEMGTSLSKQDHPAAALERFGEALASLDPANEKSPVLRVHLLSRSAVVLEQIGALKEAVGRASEAIDTVRRIGNPELEHSCLARRARTLIALGDFEGARKDLLAEEALAAHVRRGALHTAHDWARFHRARREWREALERYRECVRLLPEGPEIVSTFADIWTEILDGLEECSRQTSSPIADVVRSARADMRAMQDRHDIYGAQPVTASERRDRAARSAEEARRELLQSDREFFAAGYHFDLRRGVVVRLAVPGTVFQLGQMQCAFLECLLRAPEHRANRATIQTYIKQATGHGPSHEAVRTFISELKARLGLNRNQLVTGLRGHPGGGYVLHLD